MARQSGNILAAPLWRVAPGPARPLLAAALGAIMAVAFCWPAWPGFMSYDSLFAYTESIEGISSALWPPMSAYLFFMSRHAGTGVAGLFYGQTFLLFFSALLIFSMFARRRWAAILGGLAFAFSFVWFPVLWGTLAVLWKDVTTTSFALFALALWLLAVRTGRVFWLVACAASIFVSTALRYNAFPLTVFLVALMVVLPFGRPGERRRQFLAAGLMAGALALAFLSTRYRLPDLARLPADDGFAYVQEFDLLGISACAHENLLPAGVSHGAPVTADDIGALYDPRHVQLAFAARPGRPLLFQTDADGAVQRAWPGAIAAHPGCYLRHRAAVFAEQMGLRAHIFYPTTAGIDENPYGLRLAHPALAARLISFVIERRDDIARRAVILYGLAVVAVAAACWRRTPQRLLLVAMLLGALTYPATLFFVGPAADARYIFPSNVMCLAAIILATTDLLRRRQPA